MGRIVLALCALAVVLIHTTGIPDEPGARNILTFVVGIIAIVTLLIWFVVQSPFSSRLRGAVGIAALLVVGGLAASVRFDQFTGNMIPTFRWAWMPRGDERLERPVPAGAPADLEGNDPLAFPQFLGPTRSGVVDAVRLADSWETPPRLVWKQPIGAGWSGFAAINGYAVTMEQRGEEECVTCYEIATGKLIWVHAIQARHETVLGGVGPRATPTIDGGRVYALGGTGILRCLEGRDGTLVWQKDLPSEFGVAPGEDVKEVAWGRANSPLVVDGLVVVPAGGPQGKAVSLVAYDAKDGREIWRAGDHQISYSSPTLATLRGQPQIIVVNEDLVTGHEIATGEILWSFPWDGDSTAAANTSQPLVYDDSVVVSKGYFKGLARFAIEGREGVELYHQPSVLRTKLTSMVPFGAFAFGLSEGILECAALEDGQRQWKQGRYGHGQLLRVNDKLLVVTEQGQLVLLEANPEAHRELGRIQAIHGKTWNTLCLYGAKLLVRNAEEAACFELPLKEGF